MIDPNDDWWLDEISRNELIGALKLPGVTKALNKLRDARIEAAAKFSIEPNHQAIKSAHDAGYFTYLLDLQRLAGAPPRKTAPQSEPWQHKLK